MGDAGGVIEYSLISVRGRTGDQVIGRGHQRRPESHRDSAAQTSQSQRAFPRIANAEISPKQDFTGSCLSLKER